MSGRIVANYDYLNVKGEPRLRKVRLDPKGFRMRSADWQDDQGHWWYRSGVTDERFEFWTMALYRLPEVVSALRVDVPVWWCEGEKDVHALETLGVVATTTPNPSDLWAAQCRWFLKYGTSSDVIVVCDQDEHGGWWGWERYTGLIEVGVDLSRITVVTPKSRVHKDAADVVGAGLGLVGFRRVNLVHLQTCAERYGTARAAAYVSRGRAS